MTTGARATRVVAYFFLVVLSSWVAVTYYPSVSSWGADTLMAGAAMSAAASGADVTEIVAVRNGCCMPVSEGLTGLSAAITGGGIGGGATPAKMALKLRASSRQRFFHR